MSAAVATGTSYPVRFTDTMISTKMLLPPAFHLMLLLPSCLPAARRALEPFTHPEPLSLLSRMGLRLMPTAAQLEAAGRRDLVAAIKQAGGFLEVAQACGLRSQRKPAGFWEDEANLGGWGGEECTSTIEDRCCCWMNARGSGVFITLGCVLCLPGWLAADEELTLFVAAHWSKFEDPESRQSYWYNQARMLCSVCKF